MTPFPSLGTVVCGCDDDAACSYHAQLLYPTPPTESHDAERQSFTDASRDFYIPGWTPDDTDAAMMDARIIEEEREAGCACNSCAESAKWYNL